LPQSPQSCSRSNDSRLLAKPCRKAAAELTSLSTGFFDHERAARKSDSHPAFAAKAKREHNLDIHLLIHSPGLETVTNQILQAVKAQLPILSIERDARSIKTGRFVTSDWHLLPEQDCQ